LSNRLKASLNSAIWSSVSWSAMGAVVANQIDRSGKPGVDRGQGRKKGSERSVAWRPLEFSFLRFIRASTRRGRHIRRHPNLFSQTTPGLVFFFPFSAQIKSTQNKMSFFYKAYKECSDEIRTEQSIYTREKKSMSNYLIFYYGNIFFVGVYNRWCHKNNIAISL
jgi:hypothetical protein